MIRYGIKTWKRIALPAVFFLGVAVFLGASAWKIHHSVHKEVAAYGKIMCTLDDTTDSEMAQALFLHINTIKYRLQRISDLLGYRIGKMPETIELYRSAAIYRLLHAQHEA